MSDDNSTRKSPPNYEDFHYRIYPDHFHLKYPTDHEPMRPGDLVLRQAENLIFEIDEEIKRRQRRGRPDLEWIPVKSEDFLPGGEFDGGHKPISDEELAAWIKRTSYIKPDILKRIKSLKKKKEGRHE